MKKIALFYGSKGGNTETVAEKVFGRFDPAIIDMFCIEDVDPKKVKEYENLIFGVSTVGAETWDQASATNTWDSFFLELKETDLSGKKFAIFGLGDQIRWPDHFCDDMKVVKNKVEAQGARLVGRWPNEGYEFNESEALDGDMLIGLACDEDQQDEMTDDRVNKWTEQLKTEFGN